MNAGKGAEEHMRVFDFNLAIVRSPGKSVVAGLRTRPGPAPAYEIIAVEHEAYVAALRAAGVRVTVLQPLEQFPDSIFVEDPALVFSDAALLLRPGAPSRLAEAQELSATLEARFPQVLRLRDGYADGGDILVTPGRVFIGLSARTNQAGATELQRLLDSVGRPSEVVGIPRGTLHLKTDCSLIDEETVLATEELAQSGVLDGYRPLLVPREERGAANALRVNDVVFVRAGCPRTLDLLAKHGVTPVPLQVSEIAKIDAGLSCMSLRWFDPGST
ncbi:MAG TPA: arginine deiminase family protein [Steroidobacteraceae bacterium]|nr:arginine deiminase family protein [Steroidobacteraceae bacterium]